MLCDLGLAPPLSEPHFSPPQHRVVFALRWCPLTLDFAAGLAGIPCLQSRAQVSQPGLSLSWGLYHILTNSFHSG